MTESEYSLVSDLSRLRAAIGVMSLIASDDARLRSARRGIQALIEDLYRQVDELQVDDTEPTGGNNDA